MSKAKYTSRQKAKIKEYRHNISVLKRKGLIKKTVDARSVQITSHYQQVIKNFSQVLNGTATAVKLPPKLRKQYIETGYKGAFEKVIIPHAKGEKVVVTHGLPKTTNRMGIVKMDIPIPFHDIEQYLRDLKASKKIKKHENEKYGFRLYGFNSKETYENFDDMLERLMQYQSVVQSIDDRNPAEIQEIIEGLTWYRIGNKKLWHAQAEKARSEREKIYKAERRKQYMQRMAKSPTQQFLKYKEKHKEYSRSYYDSLSEDDKQKRRDQMREYSRKKRAKK